MKWSVELPKLQENVNTKRRHQLVDAAVLTPGALVIGEGAGSLGAAVLPTGLKKEKVQSMSKAKRKMLSKAIAHHKMDPNITLRTGGAALKHSKGNVPNAQAVVVKEPYLKALQGKKIKYLKNQSINVPQGANIEAAMHELGHLKHHQKPWGHLVSTLSKAYGKPIGAVGAVAAMTNEQTSKYAPVVVPAVMYGSTVATEGGANAFAIKEMTRQRGFKAGLKTFAKVAPYMATYLAAPVATGAALYGLRKKIYG